jgi:predicted RNase H-like HicB family nuclease
VVYNELGGSHPILSRSSPIAASYTAVIQQHGEWWIGWVEEVPGVNSQGQTRAELLANLADALEEALEMNRSDARAAASGAYEEVSLPA